ncbi:MAG: hypothetical protein PUB04_06260 [Clostridia bacterium]|nr:hypothetical protein [Clostridia bacterium]
MQTVLIAIRNYTNEDGTDGLESVQARKIRPNKRFIAGGIANQMFLVKSVDRELARLNKQYSKIRRKLNEDTYVRSHDIRR